jgi:SAM-dependent methyltransferase
VATLVQPLTTEATASLRKCRFCATPLDRTFVDLGMSPLCETYPLPSELNRGEVFFPLHVYVCDNCFLVQIEAYERPENIFSEYAYFSSYSQSWLKHSELYCNKMAEELKLGERSLVIEVASNDGYLLQYFVKKKIPVLGIEPAANVARAASEKGIPTVVRFLGKRVAEEIVAGGKRADLVVGNNVLAQVPDLNDFVEGLRALLKPDGILTLEFPHLLRLIENNEFDTIYHEHFSYFSMLTTRRILEAHGLRVFDVEELPTHGGSLRVYACLAANSARPTGPSVERLIEAEKKAGLDSSAGYVGFAKKVRQTKFAFLDFLLKAAQQGKTVAGYGAPGKSATLLHYCGIGKDLIQYTVDRNPYKQGRLLPGTHIPIFNPDRIAETKPDFIVILPWNIKDEIIEQLGFIRDWGGRFVIPIPELSVC